MPLTLVTAPASEPITVTEAKSHLRITSSDDDSYISSLIKVARDRAESFTKRALITQTWNYLIDDFQDVIEIPKPMLQSVTSITYIDTDGVSQTLAASVYTVDTDSEPGRVLLAYDQAWPGVRDQPNAVTIQFVAGYGLAGEVPEEIKQGIKLHLSTLYENREDITVLQVKGAPMTSDILFSPHRVITF